jgi:hypothetical protein
MCLIRNFTPVARAICDESSAFGGQFPILPRAPKAAVRYRPNTVAMKPTSALLAARGQKPHPAGMSRRLPPDWTLAGLELPWPDGHRSLLSQSAWRPIETGWTCSVALRHTSLPRHTRVVPLDVHLSDEAASREPNSQKLRMRARDLITERLNQRAASDVPAAHLGEVTIE